MIYESLDDFRWQNDVEMNNQKAFSFGWRGARIRRPVTTKDVCDARPPIEAQGDNC
jgi:hypothetical protein